MKIIKDHVTNKPDVVVLLDASGSMALHQQAVVDTFNEYVESVQDIANSISLYTFDCAGVVEKLLKVDPSNVKITTDDYSPRGMTPLYDAMGIVIGKFADYSTRNVQFVTHTDGAENSSKEWTYPKLEEYIKTLTDKGWLFVYLGEGVSGKEEMSKFQGVKMNFDSNCRGIAMKRMSDTTTIYGTSGSNTMDAYTSDANGNIDIKAQ